MKFDRMTSRSILVFASASTLLVSACGGDQSLPQSAPPANVAMASAVAPGTRSIASSGVATTMPVTRRPHFLGAFFRAEEAPPFGALDASSSRIEPQPYPTPGATMAGPNGYCDERAANGASIDGSEIVDPVKLAHIVDLGVGWTRMGAPQFTDDFSHVFGAGSYNFTDFDALQCATLVDHGIRPVVNFAAGPIEYNAVPGTFSPQGYALYKTPADFGTWCGAVTAHEKAVFGVHEFSSPGNEVNTNESGFPGGEPQIAAYAKACYAAIKSANSQAFVYGFELNMDGNVNAPAFVTRMIALGCKVGTCYDGIAMHLGLRYPAPSAGNTPCYPSPGGDYTVMCINAIQTAAQSPHMHVLISETQYPVPASVPDEATKALAAVADFAQFSAHSSVDGVSYANVDECAFYPTGFWANGCLIDTSGNELPAYTALQSIALAYFQ